MAIARTWSLLAMIMRSVPWTRSFPLMNMSFPGPPAITFIFMPVWFDRFFFSWPGTISWFRRFFVVTWSWTVSSPIFGYGTVSFPIFRYWTVSFSLWWSFRRSRTRYGPPFWKMVFLFLLLCYSFWVILIYNFQTAFTFPSVIIKKSIRNSDMFFFLVFFVKYLFHKWKFSFETTYLL